MHRSLFLLFLALATPCLGSLALGPENELAPSTTALRLNGEASAIAAGEDGFLSVWTLPGTLDAYATRLDTAGRPVDPVGLALPMRLLISAAVWNGREYVIAGRSSSGLVVMRVGDAGTLIDTQPRVIADALYGFDLRLTFNGEVLLVTWATQSVLTQTLAGVVLEPDLDVVKPEFVVTTRELPEIAMAPDHDTSHSVATAGDDFLVAWENVRAPNLHTFVTVDRSGKVERGATIETDSVLLEPAVVSDRNGLLLVWHDRSAIHARRIASDGTPMSDPVTLTHDEGIRGLLVASNESETGIAWTAGGSLMCPYETSPVPVLRSQRFDPALRAIDTPKTLSNAAQRAYANDIAATRTSIVTTWTSSGCSFAPQFANATALGEPST